MSSYKHIPISVIANAVAGDEKSINRILKHYEGYIIKLSLRTMIDEYGNTYMVVDNELKGRIQTAVMKMITKFQVAVI